MHTYAIFFSKVSSSCLINTCRSSSLIARMALMFTSVIVECGWPIGFVRTGTTLRFFTNIACHFNIVYLTKHSPPYYASFNSKSFSITVLPQRTQYFIATCCSATMSMFFAEKNKKENKVWNRTSILLCYRTHTIRRRLFVASLNDAYVSLLSACMSHNLSSGQYTHLGFSYIVEEPFARSTENCFYKNSCNSR